MTMLDDKWNLFIFHGNGNKHLFRGLDGVKINLNKNLNRNDYSYMLCSSWFWSQIPHEKILIFQHDSMLLRKGIEKFLDWDWIGGPSWWGGYNGGLSLRSRSRMLHVVKQIKYTGGAEDMYFHHHVGSMAPRHVANEFCCEAYFRLGTLGYHGIHNFMGSRKIHAIKNQYLKKIKVA